VWSSLAEHFARKYRAETAENALLRAEVADLTRQLATSVAADRWSYCPFCGLSAPRPGLHPDGCPGQDMQRAAHPLPREKP